MNKKSESPITNSRVWVEIDLGRIKSNFGKIAEQVKPAKVLAVLKANAYGLGVAPIAAALKEAGVAGFGVAELREALAIKHLGVPIHILGGLIADEIPVVVEQGIVAPITDLETAGKLSAEAQKQKTTVECHFLVDTGMGRLGVLYAEADDVIRKSCELPGLSCTGIYSHFPHAYSNPEFSRLQLERLSGLIGNLRNFGIKFETVHMANSDGINNIPESYRGLFNMVRTGINLYGVFDLEGRRALDIEPVLTLKTRLVAARRLPPGTTIGYGSLYRTEKETTIGTIPIGYADGLPMAMSNNGSVMLRGKPCPIIGRISMDYTTISLENVADAEVGDEVVCLGDGITVADWARIKRTVSYEIICSLGNRVDRRYM